MHPSTLQLESVDASTDSTIRANSTNRVGGCIHRLYNQSQWMHRPTLKQSVDAFTDLSKMAYHIDCPVIVSSFVSTAISQLFYKLLSLNLNGHSPDHYIYCANSVLACFGLYNPLKIY